jgi:hypothetical protein
VIIASVVDKSDIVYNKLESNNHVFNPSSYQQKNYTIWFLNTKKNKKQKTHIMKDYIYYSSINPIWTSRGLIW